MISRMFFIMLALLISLAFGNITACRSVDKSVSTHDSAAVVSHNYIADSSSLLEIHRYLQQLRQHYTFTLSDITLERDSAGNELQHVQQLSLDSKSSLVTDTTNSRLAEHTAVEVKDSAACSVQSSDKEMQREPRKVLGDWALLCLSGALVYGIGVAIDHYVKKRIT